MEKGIKKLFYGIKMTWKRVILFAIIAGVFTALMAMLVPSGNSFHEIAVSLEAWILFAIIIITNCESPKEAALKTFVFFLISQPLVYLIQVPFSWQGFGLFRYYKYWFFLTLLTLPGAYIGWYIKKDNALSAVILSVMTVLLLYLGIGYFKDMLQHFPNHLVSMIFCFAQVPLFICGIFDSKKTKWLAAVISIAAVIIFIVISFISPKSSMDQITGFSLDQEKYPVDSSWTVSVENEKISTAEIVDMGDGEYFLRVRLLEPDPNVVILKDGDGKEYRLIISYNQNEGLIVQDETTGS